MAQGGAARFHPPWQARRERADRIVQRAATRRVSERHRVCVARACSSDTDGLAGRLQSPPAARLTWPSDPKRVREPRSDQPAFAVPGSTLKLSQNGGNRIGTVARLSGCTIFWAVVRLHKCMDSKVGPDGTMAAHDRSVSEAFMRERARLRSFIRKRVPDPADAEDLLQEVFYELVQAARLVQPVEQVGAWLVRVARNRITDLFRKKKCVQFEAPESIPIAESAELARPSFEDLLPAADGGPEAVYARRLLLEELDAALDELPEEQRRVFIAHELEGRSFKELDRENGTSVNTLLSRKRYAVLHLRQRLRAIYDEFVDT